MTETEQAHTRGFERITPADAPFVPWDTAGVDRADVLAGELNMLIAPIWKSADGRQATGYWRCQPVRMTLRQAFDETLHLVEGHVSYTIDGRPPIVLRPGDSILLEKDAVATFEVHEPSMTFWAIFHDAPLDF